MSQATWPNGSDADFAGLARRRDALRQAATMPGADPLALLDATLVELDAALDAAAKLATAGAAETGGQVTSASLSAERDLSAGYLPAGEGLEVSGDFYDVFPVQDGWAITLGDVCGKGQEAAAMTAAARHAIRAIAHGCQDPVEVLTRVLLRWGHGGAQRGHALLRGATGRRTGRPGGRVRHGDRPDGPGAGRQLLSRPAA